MVAALLWSGCGAPQAVVPDADPVEGSGAVEAPVLGALAPNVEAPPVAPPRAVGVGTTVSALALDLPADEDGRFQERWLLDVPANSIVRVRMDSGAFDTLLMVEQADGPVLLNDDFGGGTNSMLQVQLSGAGPVHVVATSYGGATVGPYTLTVQAWDPSQLTPELAADAPYHSALAPADPTQGQTEVLGEDLWFYASQGTRLRLRVTSPAFDTVATLYGPGGQTWVNDDANDRGPDATERVVDSTVEAVAPHDGWYLLHVSPYGGQQSGPFQVRLTTRDPVFAGPYGTSPSTGYAGPNGRGRILGLFVGITAYASSPLPGCAEDANLLAQAFHKRRLIATGDQIVLRDAEATADNVQYAVQKLGEIAGPEDLLVVFFSGHGGIEPAADDDRHELDGTDETLVFYDQSVRDHHFGAWFDDLTVGQLVVAVDACQSGGLVRDVIDRPGRIGIFSSDEDVLSSTAPTLNAGGYLSWAMRRAVLGLGDNRPQDGAMQAGELTDFLTDVFVDFHDSMNPVGSTAPLQRLVIERGSARWDHVLWLLPRREDGTLLPLNDPAVDLDSVWTGTGTCATCQ